MTEQVMESLRRANEVRLWLAEQKRLIGDGDIELWGELAASGDERLKSVALVDFLLWLPGVGRAKARKLIAESFEWVTPRTEHRRVDRLDFLTAVRLVGNVREMYERLEEDRARRLVAA